MPRRLVHQCLLIVSCQPKDSSSALVGAVGPDQGDAGELGVEASEQQRCATAVMDVGGVHTCFEQATFSVDQNVAFATRDLLAAVVAARTAGLGGADGLAVDDGCRGLSLAADDEPVLLTQRRVDPLPGAVPTPLGIVVEHCCPGRKVVRQGAPLTSSAEQVEHGLDDAAQCEDLWMSRLLSWAKQRCKDRPFRVAQI